MIINKISFTFGFLQLVYDFRDEAKEGSFSLLSVTSDSIEVDERHEQFTKFGFELPTPM